METIITKRYQVDTSQWIRSLSTKQLDSIVEYLFEIEDFNEFKKKIVRIE